MKISQNAVELNAHFEGFFPNAYLCPAGVWTVGYGTTRINGRPVRRGDTMTQEEAMVYMSEELQVYLQNALRYIKPDIARQLNQNQLDAIAVFTYNVGPSNFSKSSFCRLINAGKIVESAERILLWNKARGKVLRGLVRRRKAEYDLFLKPMS